MKPTEQLKIRNEHNVDYVLTLMCEPPRMREVP
jgi:hypothetical protein